MEPDVVIKELSAFDRTFAESALAQINAELEECNKAMTTIRVRQARAQGLLRALESIIEIAQ